MNPYIYRKIISTRELRPFNGDKVVFSANDAGKTDVDMDTYRHMQKNEAEPLLNITYKN